MKVIVEDLVHRRVSIACKPTETIYQLRLRMQEKYKVDPDCYFLMFKSDFLDNKDTMAKRKVVNGSVIYIHFRAWAVEPDILQVPNESQMGFFADKRTQNKEI